jgi:adenine-specific DNA methylase
LNDCDSEQKGHVEVASAHSIPLPDDISQIFFTDPPYYDAVPYADLSDFFYVWLKRTVSNHYPKLFNSALTPKGEECIVDEVKGKDNDYFETTIRQAMTEGRRVLSDYGIGTVVFAHKTTSGWEAILQAMVNAGWTITASWPI